jgi:hypothetical protein
MFEISISAYSDNYTHKKMINNFHYVFFLIKFNYFSIIKSKLYYFSNHFLFGSYNGMRIPRYSESENMITTVQGQSEDPHDKDFIKY